LLVARQGVASSIGTLSNLRARASWINRRILPSGHSSTLGEAVVTACRQAFSLRSCRDRIFRPAAPGAGA
jgi:hypothetical protein